MEDGTMERWTANFWSQENGLFNARCHTEPTDVG